MSKTPPSYTPSPETVRMIQLGHPWIIADSYTKRWNGMAAGLVAHLHDSNGKFLATVLCDPHDRIVARVLDHAPITLDAGWLKKRFQAAFNLRRQHAGLGSGTTAYRLVNGEGDGLPGLTVDCYGDYLMIQIYSAGWRPHLALVTATLNELVKPKGIYEKSRPQKTRELEANSDSKKYGRLLTGSPAPQRLEVLENGLKFLVSLEVGLNSGLFLDQREHRHDLMGRVAGKRVLNLFSYTGAFSVAAASAGAIRVTSIDASPTYTDWAKEHFSINRLNPRQHEFIVGDCLASLTAQQQAKSRYDIIVMDPPSFSTTSKSRFTTRGGTSDLVAAALPLLVEGGLLICSSNHQKVDTAEYLKELRRGALQAGGELRVITLSGQGIDFPYPVTFPEGRYLKYVISVKQSGG